MSSQTETLSDEILKQLKDKGVSKESALFQIETFKRGIPFTELLRPCTLGEGIENIDPDRDEYISLYESKTQSKKVIKFVC